MKIATASGIAVADLARALQLDLEHHRRAAAGAPLELRAQRAVAMSGVGRVLEELAERQPAVEVRLGEEVVGDAVLLPRPRRARRRRHRQAESRGGARAAPRSASPCRPPRGR